MTAQAISLTGKVTTRWDDRLVGSKACLDCGKYLLEYVDEFCDTTRIQKIQRSTRCVFGIYGFCRRILLFNIDCTMDTICWVSHHFCYFPTISGRFCNA